MNKILFKSIGGRWVLNIPVKRRTVLVIGRGRLLKSGKFNNYLPCAYFLKFTANGHAKINPDHDYESAQSVDRSEDKA